MLQYVTSVFATLNKNAHPGDVAHGVALGFLLAVMPKDNLLWPLLFVFVFFVRLNKGAYFLTLVLVSFLAPFMDVFIERIGFWALNLAFMHPIYVFMDTIPFMGLTKFYNTMVMGGLVFGLLMYIPVYTLAFIFVVQYRKLFKSNTDKVLQKSGASKLIYNVPVIRHITKLSGLKEFFKK